MKTFKKVAEMGLYGLVLCGLLVWWIGCDQIETEIPPPKPQPEIVTYSISGLKGKTSVRFEDEEVLNIVLSGYSGPAIQVSESVMNDLKAAIEKTQSGVIIFHRKAEEK